MWKSTVDFTAALYLNLILLNLSDEGAAVAVLAPLGQRDVMLLCDNATSTPQLSVQWRGPDGTLRCHYIKHKAFTNCTTGYQVHDRHGNITLTIQEVKVHDFGVHVCSVSRPHDFSDHSVELVRTVPVTSRPTGGANPSGLGRRLALLHVLTFLPVCFEELL